MIKAGLIGLGKMGISHQAILNSHPDVDLAAVCDSSRYVTDVIGKYTGVKTFSDYRSMLEEQPLDAVVVATPSRFHGEIVRHALAKGLHVFCEKPFCLDLREGEELIGLASKAGRVNQVGYHFRHVEAFREAKRLLDAGVLGRLHHVRAEAYGPVVLRPAGSTWRASKNEGGGCLYDYASHAIDLVNFLVGVPESVGGVVLNKVFSRDVEDELYATCRMANGATAQIAVNWSDETHRKMSTKVTVWGTNGRISVDRQECQIYLREAVTQPEKLDAGWTIRYTTDLTPPVWYYLRGEEYSGQIDHFVQCVKGAQSTNACSFAAALQTDQVIAAMVRAQQAGDWVPVVNGAHDVAQKPAARGGFFSRLRQ